MTDNAVLQKIEYFTVAKLAAGFAVNDAAKEAVISGRPVNNRPEAATLLRQTSQAFEILYERMVYLVDSFDAVDNILEKCRVNSTLTPAELLKVVRLIRVADNAKTKFELLKEFDFDAIAAFMVNITELKELGDQISGIIINGGEIADNASPELKRIRKDINNAKSAIRDKLNSYIRSGARYLQDAIITIRNDRFVIPVKSEHRGELKGLLHDRSSSGATVFIEPMPIVELNNRLIELNINEQQEIERILFRLTQEVSAVSAELAINQQSLIMLDAVCSRARYSESIKGVLPELTDELRFEIINGRHPLIAVDSVVPINISLGKTDNILVISGPNTGGKTVSLKTVGLFSAMAAAGFFVPAASGTTLTVYDAIYCDIGDNQSIEHSLSTYSSHIKTIIGIIDNLKPNSLVLMDELGAGTDPQEGAALAIAIVKHLSAHRVLSIITTHYTELKDYSMAGKGIKNASMEFDPQTLLPTYRILMDVPGTSNAIAIARHLGLSQSIIDDANKALSQERHSFENILRLTHRLKSQAEQERQAAEQERAAIEQERKQITQTKAHIDREWERLKERSDKEIKRMVADRLEKANDLLAQLEQITKDAELAGGELLRAKQLRTKLEGQVRREEGYFNIKADVPIAPKDIKVGLRVKVAALNRVGVVKSLPDKKGDVLLESDGITLSVSAQGLVSVKSEDSGAPRHSKPSGKPAKVTVNVSKSTEQVATEINLIGKTVPEALAELDRALDAGLVSQAPGLKIIHGKGTGTLRAAIHSHLKEYHAISEYSLGSLAEGGSGVTIVKF